MKNSIEFYQHYAVADQHPKFKMLRSEFGWSGEGKFWALNNRIAQSEDCLLDISKKYNKAAVASDLDFSIKEFDKFISFLLSDCELVKEVQAGVITTDIIQENYKRVSHDRAEARKRSARRWKNIKRSSGEEKKSSGEEKKSSGEERCKGKESKVKETIYTRVVSYLNKKTNSKYRPTSKATQKLIKARQNEGFKPEDFKVVIDYCCKQWLPDEKMHQYLRPETIFSNKFEGYLSAAGRKINGSTPETEDDILERFGFE